MPWLKKWKMKNTLSSDALSTLVPAWCRRHSFSWNRAKFCLLWHCLKPFHHIIPGEHPCLVQKVSINGMGKGEGTGTLDVVIKDDSCSGILAGFIVDREIAKVRMKT